MTSFRASISGRIIKQRKNSVTRNFLNPERMYECGEIYKFGIIFHIGEVQNALIVSPRHEGFEIEDTTGDQGPVIGVHSQITG